MYYRNKTGRDKRLGVAFIYMYAQITCCWRIHCSYGLMECIYPDPLKLLIIPYTSYQFMMNKHDIEITAMQLIKSNMKSSHAFVHKTWRFKNYVLYNHNWTTACEVAGHETPANVFTQVIPFQVTYKMLSINTTCFTNAWDI